VDDILIVARNKTHIQKLKTQLKKKFDMEDLREVKKIVGIEITRDRATCRLWLSQENYALKVLKRFNMIEARPSHHSPGRSLQIILQAVSTITKDEEEMSQIPYASVVGSLMYAMVSTRPDLAYAVSTVSQFMSNLGK